MNKYIVVDTKKHAQSVPMTYGECLDRWQELRKKGQHFIVPAKGNRSPRK